MTQRPRPPRPLWVYHRPPTAADADETGEVWMLSHPTTDPRMIWLTAHWSHVGPTTPWSPKRLFPGT